MKPFVSLILVLKLCFAHEQRYRHHVSSGGQRKTALMRRAIHGGLEPPAAETSELFAPDEHAHRPVKQDSHVSNDATANDTMGNRTGCSNATESSQTDRKEALGSKKDGVLTTTIEIALSTTERIDYSYDGSDDLDQLTDKSAIFIMLGGAALSAGVGIFIAHRLKEGETRGQAQTMARSMHFEYTADTTIASKPQSTPQESTDPFASNKAELTVKESSDTTDTNELGAAKIKEIQEKMELERAAIKIQAHWRGRQGRNAAADKRKSKLRRQIEEEGNKAATKIQAVHRGRQGRKEAAARSEQRKKADEEAVLPAEEDL